MTELTGGRRHASLLCFHLCTGLVSYTSSVNTSRTHGHFNDANPLMASERSPMMLSCSDLLCYLKMSGESVFQKTVLCLPVLKSPAVMKPLSLTMWRSGSSSLSPVSHPCQQSSCLSQICSWWKEKPCSPTGFCTDYFVCVPLQNCSRVLTCLLSP